ncbi:MAG: Hpt domain-containing protein [Caulobacterales bacterium]|nr:Hpt domain-containing protein [Caulobacterales bacterium]
MARASSKQKLPSLDEEAIARAEAALQNLSSEFSGWIQDELENLQTAFAAAKAADFSGAAGEELYRRAHDLKGLGTTYEYPLVSQLAASMCRLLENEETRAAAPKPLISAHVAAIQASIRDEVKTADHPLGGALLQELDTQTTAFLSAR